MRIVVLDGYALNPGDNPWLPLTIQGDVEVYERTPASCVLDRAWQAHVLVINKVRLDAETLRALPELKLVAITATGHDVVDLAAAGRLGITVSNVPEYGTEIVAQHTLALLLELCHRVGRHDHMARQGAWRQRGDFCYWETPPVELVDKTMGIIGWGRIGRMVGRLAHALGMHLLVHSRRQQPANDDPPLVWADPDALCQQSHVVTLHCPLNAASRHLIGARRLRLMPSDGFLINTARGPLVVESELAEVLAAGHLAGAALDVFETEPLPADSPLWQAPRLILTPHMAWASLPARRRLLQTTAENIAAFARGAPQNVVTS